MNNPIYTVGDACNIITGKLDSNQFIEGGQYPFFTCSAEPSTIDNYAYDDSVILVAGNNARGNFHVSRYTGKFNAYQRTYILTSKTNYNLDYIYYALKLELKRLKEKSQGSQTKFLTMPILTSINLGNRKLKEQSEIANTLSSLDKKIQLNNQINSELEAMAKTLYDYWFVQFDFPDAHGKPYRSSGGEMVYSEELKREIPRGWEVKELKDLITIERGISYKSTDLDKHSGVPMINLNSFYLNGSYKPEGIKFFKNEYQKKKVVKTGDLIIATTDVTRNADIIGKATIVPNIYENDILLSCDIAKIIYHDSLDKYFLEKLFNSDYYHDYIKGFASGTLVLHLNTNGIGWYKTFIPPKDLLSKFANLMNSIQRKKELITLETQELATLRDWLLPMLMNGQVRVK